MQINDIKEPWQIRLFRRSFKKRIKWKILKKIIPPLKDDLCLDLGCAKGTISYLLRGLGGRWVSADLDMDNLKETKGLVKKGVIKIDPIHFCFRDSTFDNVVTLDFLEHIKDDDSCVDEIKRVLRPGGYLYISTPTTGRFFLLNKLKKKIGLSPEVYGHVREGYRIEDLRRRLKDRGFIVSYVSTYSKFFTETIETALNLGYIVTSKNKKTGRRDGSITLSSQEEFNSKKFSFRIYSFIFPLLWLFSLPDKLLLFSKGYAIILKAKKA